MLALKRALLILPPTAANATFDFTFYCAPLFTAVRATTLLRTSSVVIFCYFSRRGKLFWRRRSNEFSPGICCRLQSGYRQLLVVSLRIPWLSCSSTGTICTLILVFRTHIFLVGLFLFHVVMWYRRRVSCKIYKNIRKGIISTSINRRLHWKKNNFAWKHFSYFRVSPPFRLFEEVWSERHRLTTLRPSRQLQFFYRRLREGCKAWHSIFWTNFVLASGIKNLNFSFKRSHSISWSFVHMQMFLPILEHIETVACCSFLRHLSCWSANFGECGGPFPSQDRTLCGRVELLFVTSTLLHRDEEEGSISRSSRRQLYCYVSPWLTMERRTKLPRRNLGNCLKSFGSCRKKSSSPNK